MFDVNRLNIISFLGAFSLCFHSLRRLSAHTGTNIVHPVSGGRLGTQGGSFVRPTLPQLASNCCRDTGNPVGGRMPSGPPPTVRL